MTNDMTTPSFIRIIGLAATGLVLCLVVACGRTDPPVPWDMAQMVRELTSDFRRYERLTSDFDQTEVLAWRTCTAGAEFFLGRGDTALLWGRTRTSVGASTWVLAQGYRLRSNDEPWRRCLFNRNLIAPLTHLRPGEDADGTWHGIQRYDHPPTSGEVCEFAEVDFLAGSNECRTVSAAIRRNAWHRVAGADPQCFLAK